MPSLGADMEAGTLVTWRCAPGDRVKRGDIVAEVETEKGLVEIESFETGQIDRLLVPPGTRVPVGTALASLRDGAGAAAPTPPTGAPETAPPRPARPAAAPAREVSPPLPAAAAAPRAAPTAPAAAREPTPPVPGVAPEEARLHRFPPSIRHEARERGIDPLVVLEERYARAPAPEPVVGRLRIAPRARRRAEELGVDPAGVTGTGPAGAITTEDVERAAARAPAAPARAEDAQARMRRAIAASMERSNREIPHYHVATTIDLTRALAWLATRNAGRTVEDRLVPGVLLLKASALALRKVPELNATWENGALRPLEHVHLGVAVSLRGGGLIAPAIHDADRMELPALMAALSDVVSRARAGRLRSSELADPTCTVTSLGERGVEVVIPRISPPQVAMIGFGRVAEEPRVVDGRLEPRSVVHATLAGDHRASDGHRGAAYLVALDDLLQHPEAL